jgi:hypothetical protein
MHGIQRKTPKTRALFSKMIRRGDENVQKADKSAINHL